MSQCFACRNFRRFFIRDFGLRISFGWRLSILLFFFNGKFIQWLLLQASNFFHTCSAIVTSEVTCTLHCIYMTFVYYLSLAFAWCLPISCQNHAQYYRLLFPRVVDSTKFKWNCEQKEIKITIKDDQNQRRSTKQNKTKRRYCAQCDAGRFVCTN